MVGIAKSEPSTEAIMKKDEGTSSKRALMYWCRIAGIRGGTKPERFASLAVARWGCQLSGVYTARGYCYPSLAKQVEAIVKKERKAIELRKVRASEAQELRRKGLI